MGNDIISCRFDYNLIEPTDREFFRSKAIAIHGRIKMAAGHIVAIGLDLISVKDRMRHGVWGAWLDGEFRWDERTAQRYMMVARAFKSDTVSDLDIAPGALYMLASPSVPEEARQEAIDRASNGQTITKTEAKLIIEGHQPTAREVEAAAEIVAPRPARPEPEPPPTLLFTDPVDDDDGTEDDAAPADAGNAATAPAPPAAPMASPPAPAAGPAPTVAPTPPAPAPKPPTPEQLARQEDERNAEAWLKLIEEFNLLTNSIRRRGGLDRLAASWSPAQITRAVAFWEKVRDTSNQCISILAEIRK